METGILILTGILGALGTFIVNNDFDQGAVRASALLSLIVGLFFFSFPEVLPAYLTKNIPLVFIGASFIGMVSSRVISRYILVGIAGAIFSIIYLNTSEFFAGYGGALGTTAAISVLVSLGLAFAAKSKTLAKLKRSNR
jgi:hypothetical protein